MAEFRVNDTILVDAQKRSKGSGIRDVFRLKCGKGVNFI